MTAREKYNSSDFFKLVCVGDFQTAQPYGKPSWTDWIQRALWENGEVQTSWRRQVINSAVSRATPKHVATYFLHYVEQFKPDVVLLSFGISPMFPEFDEKNFINELETLLSLSEKFHIPVVLWSPYPLLAGVNREVTLTLGAIYKQKAIEHNLQFIDLLHDFDEIELSKIFTYKVGVKTDLFKQEVAAPDAFTLNKIGQYIVAKRICADLLNISLPSSDSGDFITPNVESLKRWNGVV